MRAHAYSKILSDVPLTQPEDGQYRPKHVVVHYIVIKYTSCDILVFDCIPFSKVLNSSFALIVPGSLPQRTDAMHKRTPTTNTACFVGSRIISTNHLISVLPPFNKTITQQ